jgi:NAD(P)H-hydrate epimerase
MYLTRDQARELYRRAMEEFGVPSIVLMENAGRGMAELLTSLGIQGRVVLCCGKGNNGGDGFVMARHLDNAGARVRVLLFADPATLSGDALVNYRIIERSGLSIRAFSGESSDEKAVVEELALADWIVDALFGTGLRGAIGPPLDRVVSAINAAPGRVFAVDIPSGLDSDTGHPLGPVVRAHHTATVAAPRKGFTTAGAGTWLGKVHVVDLGIPRKLLAEVMAR